MTPEVKQEVKMRDALAKTQKNGTGNFTTKMTNTGGRCSDKKSKGGTGNSKTYIKDKVRCNRLRQKLKGGSSDHDHRGNFKKRKGKCSVLRQK